MIEPSSSALLLLDYQAAVVERLGGHAAARVGARALAACRSVGMSTIAVRVGYRPGYPEISSRNLIGRSVAASGRLTVGSDSAAFHPDCGVGEGSGADVVIDKRRVGAFRGTELELLLRANNITTLVIAGITTSGTVLSTVRDAADRDYELFVLRDGCIDGDPAVHDMLMTKVFPRQAEVVTVADLQALLPSPG